MTKTCYIALPLAIRENEGTLEKWKTGERKNRKCVLSLVQDHSNWKANMFFDPSHCNLHATVFTKYKFRHIIIQTIVVINHWLVHSFNSNSICLPAILCFSNRIAFKYIRSVVALKMKVFLIVILRWEKKEIEIFYTLLEKWFWISRALCKDSELQKKKKCGFFQ